MSDSSLPRRTTSAIREFFVLGRQLGIAAQIPETVRAQVEGPLLIGAQKHAASVILWNAGHGAEALPLMQEALRLLLEAGAMLVDGSPASQRSSESAPESSDWFDPLQSARTAVDAISRMGPLLSALGVSDRKLDMIASVCARHIGVSFPTRHADLGPSHEEAYAVMRKAYTVLAAGLAKAVMSPRRVRGTRRKRFAATILAGLLAAGALFWLLRTPQRFNASCSAYYATDPRWAPGNVVDDAPNTEWLLPDATTGWIELRPNPVMNLKAIRILNAHNNTSNDRATHQYRIEVYSKGVLMETILGQYSAFSKSPTWVEHQVSVRKADRVRIDVLSYFERGGGLAEIELR